LLGAVYSVIGRPERPQYIVLEASGVAEPSGIAATFLDAGFGDRIRLDSIMCLADASQIFAAPELMDLKLRQIAYGDMLILSKSDLVSRAEIARIRDWLDAHFSRYRLQVVGKRVDISIENAWGEQSPSTRIVAIGAAGGFEDAFASCIAA